ncbi:hypothetical protein CLOSTMETH_02252 [[Clostridium] methylpentosum DSM 5476]|uniref:Uncharacterized protein n=1 Tax=[Clostridium] methylpentosum DSM 5476 TaxID=537013 RepID=C0EEG6_9FIRM|nr:hypothetical protein CLOSTMETH_02252 [[Clostridium] methylpentosum DSM 5476]
MFSSAKVATNQSVVTAFAGRIKSHCKAKNDPSLRLHCFSVDLCKRQECPFLTEKKALFHLPPVPDWEILPDIIRQLNSQSFMKRG